MWSLRKARKYVLLANVLLALYILSYCMLSSTGHYVFARSGRARWNNTFLAVSDVIEWQPHSLAYSRYRTVDDKCHTRGNTFGYFYSPLVRLDRRFVHRTRSLDEVELVEGGVYVVDSFSGKYEVARVLALRHGAVLYYMYDNVYAKVPDKVSCDKLTVDDGTMILAAMREEVFKQAHPRFLFHESLTTIEEAYVEQEEPIMKPEMWKEHWPEL